MKKRFFQRQHIMLTDFQIESLQCLAELNSIPKAELHRRILDLYLQQITQGRPVGLAVKGYTVPENIDPVSTLAGIKQKIALMKGIPTNE